MTDDSFDIETSMDLHPCNRPHGMKDYVLKDITPDQQAQLNIRKRSQIRADQTYLAMHPEIRGLIIMILRIVMKTRPKFGIYEAIGQYFTKPSVDVKEEIYNYLDERSQLLSENSAIVEQEWSIGSSPPMSIISDEEEKFDEVTEKFLREEEMADIIKEEIEEKETEERPIAFCVRWEGADEENMEEHRIIVEICQEVINEILNNLFDEVETQSILSIESVAFLVDYEDHAFAFDDEE